MNKKEIRTVIACFIGIIFILILMMVLYQWSYEVNVLGNINYTFFDACRSLIDAILYIAENAK